MDHDIGDNTFCENLRELQDSVFDNDLIGQEITKYLTFEDMRMASLVCKSIHRMVRNSKHFSMRTTLRLSDIGPNKESIWEDLQLSSRNWGTIEIDMRFASEILDFLDRNIGILANVNNIRLSLSSEFPDYDVEEDITSSISHYRSILIQEVFAGCDFLNELQIFEEILRRHDFVQLLRPVHAKHIKTLEIIANHRFHIDNMDLEKSNIEFLGLFLHATKIKLSMRRHCLDFNDVIMKLLLSQSGSIQTLHMDLLNLYIIDSYNLPILPELKHVKLTNWSDLLSTIFIKFLHKQSPLKTVDVDFSNQCPTIFLEYLQSNSENLERLKLSAFSLQEELDWTFLSTCSKLKEFSIHRKRNTYCKQREMHATAVSFLRNLPSSVTQLSIQNFQHFWKVQQDLNGPLLSSEQIISILSRFHNMRKLDFTGCKYGAVTDLVIQTIIGNMPILREFKISNADFTNDSIVGYQDGGECSKLSLRNLTGLTQLSITHCPNITFAGILNSVKHHCLKTFVFQSKHEIFGHQIQQLADQNCNLVTLDICADLSKIVVPTVVTSLKGIRHWTKLALEAIQSSDTDSYESSSSDED